ncbi:hypothetical protein ACJ41O_005770 [Fusarium nematophilum]
MRSYQFTAVALSSFATWAYAADSFSLFAYGNGIGGLPMFSTGGDVFVGNFSSVGNPEAAPVLFTTGDSTWSGSPNTTGYASDQSPTWSNLTFAVPGPSSSSHNVTLVNGTADTSNLVTSFSLYGSFVFVDEDGTLVSLWYGTPSGVDGVYSLGWNASSDDASSDKVLITLKRTPPSNPSNNAA